MIGSRLKPEVKLTRREQSFLRLLNEPGATVAEGLTVGFELHQRGLVQFAKFGRYGITDAGRAAIEAYEKQSEFGF
jgi:hypothetical protein